MSQQVLMREFDLFNEKEAMQKRMEKQNQREQSYNEYKNNLQQYQSMIDAQRQIEKEKKEKLRKEQENDLQNFYKKKDMERLERIKEGKNNIELFQQENKRRLDSYSQYKSKIDSMNSRIYNNAMKYNEFVNGGANGDVFKTNNDFDFNKKIAEMHSKEKHDRLYNSAVYLKMREEEEKKQKNYDAMMQQQKVNNQQNYKSFLDQQNEQKKITRDLNRKSALTESAEQLLMPSYKYPNLPQPIKKKAFDPLNYFEKQNSPIVNNYSTERPGYLGDSRLRHNPITCPVDDVEYNRYVSNDLNKYFNRGSVF